MGEGRRTDSWPPTSWQRRLDALIGWNFDLFHFHPDTLFCFNKVSVDFVEGLPRNDASLSDDFRSFLFYLKAEFQLSETILKHNM